MPISEMVALYQEAIDILRDALDREEKLSSEQHERLISIYKSLEHKLRPPPVRLTRSSPQRRIKQAVRSIETRANAGHVLTRAQAQENIKRSRYSYPEIEE